MQKINGPLIIITLFFLAACSRASGPNATPTPTSPPPPSATPIPSPEPSPTPEPTPTFPIPAYEPTFVYGECSFELPPGQLEGESIECGYLEVPENRANPEQGSIRLATAIFHPPGEQTGPDPIIYLVGGPGASILELLYLSFDQVYAPVLESGRTLIMFDQRGVGLSEPALDCHNVTDLSLDLMDNQLDGREVTNDEALVLLDEAFQDCAANLDSIADLSAYNTVANAADVNDLRIALDYDEVNLWGASYGTRLALGVMRDFPDGIRSVILDSTYPPDVDIFLDTPENVDRSLNLLFQSCAADDECNQAYPSLDDVFLTTLEELDENPAELIFTNPLTGQSYDALLTGDGFLGLIFQLLYETDIIPILPELIYDAYNKNFVDIARIQGLLLIQSELSSQGMTYSVFCNEELSFSTLDNFNDAVDEYPYLSPFLRRSGLGEIGYSICAYWGAGESNRKENQPIHSDLPTLVMQGEFDPITPPQWGEQAAETLTNSHYFLYPGVGHGVLSTECGREMLIAFLQDPSKAPNDSCISEMAGVQFAVPFDVSEAIELEAYSIPEKGFQGLRPVGWTEAAPGTYARLDSPLDETVLLIDVAPLDPDSLLALLSNQLEFVIDGIDADIASYGSLTWYIYTFESGTAIIDLAASEGESGTFMVMLVSSVDERNHLFTEVFEPAVQTMMPIP